MVIPALLTEDLPLHLSGDENEEVEAEHDKELACAHLQAPISPALVRSAKLEKSLGKLKSQLDQYELVCLHCTRVFSSREEAREHGSKKHAVMMNLKNERAGEIVCSQCSFQDVARWIKPSLRTEYAALHLTIRNRQQQQPTSMKKREEGVITTCMSSTILSSPRGLKNLGNTCFFNSCLQLLMHSPTLCAVLQSNSFGPIAQSLASFAHHYHTATNSTLNPKSLFDTVCARAANHLGDGFQHDAQELLMFMLAGMDDESGPIANKAIPARYTAEHEWRLKHAAFWFANECQVLERASVAEAEDEEPNGALTLPGDLLDFIHSPDKLDPPSGQEDRTQINITKTLFELEVESCVTCETCRTASKTREIHSMLSLALGEGDAEDVAACFHEYFRAPDKLLASQNNAYACGKCKTARNAMRTLSLSRTGPVLLLHLKRFKQNGNRLVKLQDRVVAPDCLQVLDQDYRLVGFVEHLGASLTKGHYVAHVRSSTNTWYRCSDESIAAVSSAQARNAQVYIAMYEEVVGE